MTIDYYLSVGSLVAGIVTGNPILQAVPTMMNGIANLCPTLYPIGLTKTFFASEEEQRKLTLMKKLLKDVSRNVGIEAETTLRVSRQLGRNACMIGHTSSFGGPLLCLGDDYFTGYQLEENQDWLRVLDALPDDPIELGKRIDQLKAEKKSGMHVLMQGISNRGCLF